MTKTKQRNTNNFLEEYRVTVETPENAPAKNESTKYQFLFVYKKGEID